MAKVTGMDRLRAKFNALPKHAKVRVRDAVEKSAQEMVALMKSLAPHKTGALRNSIGYTFGSYRPDNANVRGVTSTSSGSDVAVTLHAGDKTAWYASLVEFGTVEHVIKAKRPGGLLNVNGRLLEQVHHPGAKASPFFYPAYRALRRSAKNRISRAVIKALREVAAG